MYNICGAPLWLVNYLFSPSDMTPLEGPNANKIVQNIQKRNISIPHDSLLSTRLSVHSCMFVNVCLSDCVCVCVSVLVFDVFAWGDRIRRNDATRPWGLSSWLSELALCKFRFKTAAYYRHTLGLSKPTLRFAFDASSRLNGACTCWEI